LAIGLPLAAHGAQKVFGWFGGHGPDPTGQFMETLGFRPGRRHAIAAGSVEIAGGLLLALGFLTPLGAALVASVMVVAAATVHVGNGFFTRATASSSIWCSALHHRVRTRGHGLGPGCRGGRDPRRHRTARTAAAVARGRRGHADPWH
jgi:uncharacterized membrane protein YphA (DoxX/SURF4 family)